MKRFIKIAALSGLVTIILFSTVSCSKETNSDTNVVPSTKKERNFMKEGTDLYKKKRYAEAEVSYNKALGENPDNRVAKFNLASTYIKQRGEDADSKGDSLMSRANAMLAELSAAPEPNIAQAAYYDRGNLSYKGEDYASAVEHYKNALRRNPADNAARENLRLAQLKLQQQQQQNQNKDQNQDNQDQNKDQQDKKDQQQNQDQNQDQNKDQNKDNQDQQNQNQQNKNEQQKPQQQNGGLSDANAQQILKAMEDKEEATRQKLEKMKQGKAARSSKRQPEKPW